MILPEFGYGGAEKSFSSLSIELARDYNVKIVVFNLKQVPVYAIGGEVLSLNTYSSNNWFIKLHNLHKRVKQLREFKKQLKPAVSISFLEGADYINILSSKEETTVLSIRGSKLFDQNISSLTGFIRKRILIPYLYLKASHIITLSKGIEEELLETYPGLKKSRVDTIYNFIDEQKVITMANEVLSKKWAAFFDKYKVILISSRLAVEKGIHLFLPVFAEIAKQLTDIRLVIIGDGEYLELIQQKCRELSLTYDDIIDPNAPSNTKVSFLGYQSNPFKWIRNSDIFVSASLHEGFGNSILEASICGATIIASDCPYGPREIIAKRSFKENIDYPYQTNKSFLLPIISDFKTSELWIQTILNILTKNGESGKLNNAPSIELSRFSKAEFLNKWKIVLEN